MSETPNTGATGRISMISFKLRGSSKRSIQSAVRPAKSLRLQTVIPVPTPAARRELIIPLIKKNQWRIQKQQPHSATGKRGKGEDVGVASHEDNEILKDIQAGKFSTGGVEGGKGTDGPVIPLLIQNKPPVDVNDDKLNDLELRPDASSIDDYTDMPINAFGAAMLKGMGWKPGEAIGLNRKGLLEPIEYIPRPGGLGLGATVKPPERKKNKMNYVYNT